MVVYVDVLVFLNYVIDFLMLKACSLLLKRNVRLWRYVAASFFGALSSLSIFLPSINFAFEIVLKLATASITVLICYGFKGIKVYLKTLLSFFTASLLFGGMMLAVKSVFTIEKINIKNGVVYYDISPLLLLTLSFFIYLIILFSKKLYAKNNPKAEKLLLTVTYNGKIRSCFAAVDSGHSLRDPIDGRQVIVIDKAFAEKILGNELTLLLVSNTFDYANSGVPFRLIPLTTVSGNALKPAIMLDNVTVERGTETNLLGKTLCVVFDGVLGADHSALISPI